MSADVFISYAREDRETAREVAHMVERAGLAVWWDRELVPGNAYAEVIEGAIDTAKAVIVLWSEASRKSHWVRDEAAVGRDRNRLVPIVLDSVPPPLGFRQIQSAEMAALRADARTRESLVASLNALCGRGAPAERTEARPAPPPAVVKPVQQILQEEKRQRNFVRTYWLMGLPIALVLGLVVAVLGNYAETYPIRSFIGNAVLGFVLASASLGLGRLLIVAGRRLSKRKSVRYFDGPTSICFILSALLAAALGLIAAAGSGPGDSALVAVFIATFLFPVFALGSVPIGALKGADRTTFEDGR